ncbi:gamma-glutamyltranspeptidase [Aureimonas sp. SA4125]|uniref:gamma-glutamyltransferase n=1 Tax=Aureimonas sp. SA4125 TaxID=2826993 RepID=UPI001CC36BBE|nr:gamma-glutamyltransferase [Aureimonas sp. SA4125]BDA86340.1 gamma-glutamyltranspeptidase [Aureimonas sp. SA4125]
MLHRFAFGLTALAFLAAPLQAQQLAPAPEAASGVMQKVLVRAKSQMVVAAHPLAAEAGREVLRAGGNAIDAMVTVQLVLGLVEPQSSGLGGGAFLVHYDASTKQLETVDGRETAPAGVTPQLFLDASGKPLTFLDAVVGGRSVGTPGTVRLLEDTHRRFGALSWRRVVQPAIDLARTGFAVTPRLNSLLAGDETLLSSPTLKAYFFDADAKPWPVGHILVNEAYAKTLERIRDEGAAGFYTGPVADGIVAAVASGTDLAGKANPGMLSRADLAAYRAKVRPPVCLDYRGFEVCGMGPPSSGALAVGQILGLIEPTDIADLGPKSAKAWRLIGDASRLAFADRGRYVADADFVALPSGLLDDAYLASRATLLDGDRALADDAVVAGEPSWDHAGLAPPRGDDASLELPSTSHFVIADKEGDVVSMTTTIENGFGSRLMTGGFILNNELTDFSFATQEDGRPIANAVAPGKRPRSSMAPTIVMKEGKPVIAVGSPGGSSIIGFVAGALVAMIDWRMDAQQAVALPHLLNRFGTFELEKGTPAADLEPELQALGFKTKVGDLNSGLHAIVITPDGLAGGADPRREGVALGD